MSLGVLGMENFWMSLGLPSAGQVGIWGDGIGLEEVEMVCFWIIFGDLMELIFGFEDVHFNG